MKRSVIPVLLAGASNVAEAEISLRFVSAYGSRYHEYTYGILSFLSRKT